MSARVCKKCGVKAKFIEKQGSEAVSYEHRQKLES
jgi:hypothetical protein